LKLADFDEFWHKFRVEEGIRKEKEEASEREEEDEEEEDEENGRNKWKNEDEGREDEEEREQKQKLIDRRRTSSQIHPSTQLPFQEVGPQIFNGYLFNLSKKTLNMSKELLKLPKRKIAKKVNYIYFGAGCFVARPVFGES
jgi:hypothetical protein